MAISFSTCILLVNNSARGANLGLVTGISQAVASSVRALLPTIAGGIFSASLQLVELGSARLLGAYLLFAALAICGSLSSLSIPRYCNVAFLYTSAASKRASAALTEGL